MFGLVFTYLMTWGGFAVSLWRPYYGLLVYICFAIVKPPSLWWWSVPADGNYSKIIAIGLILGWVIHGFGNFQFGKSKLIISVLTAYLMWEALSMALCPSPGIAWWYFEVHYKIVIPFVIGVTLVKDKKQVDQLAWTIMLSMGFIAFQLNDYYFSGFNIIQRRGFLELDNNGMAAQLATVVSLGFFLGFDTKNPLLKTLAFSCSAITAHAIFFSFSRGGILALCVVGLISFILLPKRPINVVVFATGVFIALCMAGPEVRERFGTVFADKEELDESAESRTVLWKGAIAMMNDHPLFGVGPDHFKLNVQYYTPYDEGKAAHTTWLQTGAETGYPGLLLLLSFYLMNIQKCYSLIRRNRYLRTRTPVSYKPHMVIVSLAGFMVAASFITAQLHELPFYIALLGVADYNCQVGAEKASNVRFRSGIGVVASFSPQPESGASVY